MITYCLPYDLPDLDGIGQSFRLDADECSDVSVIEIATFAIYGKAITSEKLREYDRKVRCGEVQAVPSAAAASAAGKFYHYLGEAFRWKEIQLGGIPIDAMTKEPLSSDGQSKFKNPIPQLIQNDLYAGNLVHCWIGFDWGHNDDFLFLEQSVNDEKSTLARAWQHVTIPIADARLVHRRFNADRMSVASTARETAETQSRKKPGPQSDKAYIEEHAKKALPDGKIPDGMTKTEARRAIVASMERSKSANQNKRTPKDKTFQRHGY
jgi:hypothetical protein